jgi:hypothetical protein
MRPQGRSRRRHQRSPVRQSRHSAHTAAIQTSAMFANVAAGAMYRPTAHNTHPAFVEVLRQLAPADARFLRLITDKAAWPAGITSSATAHPVGGPSVTTYGIHVEGWRAGSSIPHGAGVRMSSDNLERLGLVERTERGLLVYAVDGRQVRLDLTSFGEAFTRACFLGASIIPATPTE